MNDQSKEQVKTVIINLEGTIDALRVSMFYSMTFGWRMPSLMIQPYLKDLEKSGDLVSAGVDLFGIPLYERRIA